MQEIILKVRHYERELSKSLKKRQFTFFCRTQYLSIDKIIKNKRGLELVTVLFRLRSKFRKIPLLVMYNLTKFDDVIENGFWVILKITSANLCKRICDINYSTSICPSEPGKCEKEGKNYKNLNILRTKRAFYSF